MPMLLNERSHQSTMVRRSGWSAFTLIELLVVRRFRTVRFWTVFSGLVVLGLMVGCSLHRDGRRDGGRGVETEQQQAELALYMSRLQWHSEKLGFAIQGRNGRLAEFYLEEVGEVLEEVKSRAPVHDGLPIANLVTIIADPEIKLLNESLENNDWSAIDKQYLELVNSCNRCHSATQHEFIVILPVEGKPPFSQRFIHAEE